jgi:pimeloyl-ACP methyl ester carboxylesterase
VIAFDRPGFGYSGRPRSTIWSPAEQAEVIHKALIKLGMGRPIVVSHSWGTLVALALALNYPKDVAALVLLAGYYLPSARADAVLFSPPALPLIGDLLRFTISPLVGRVMAPSMFKAMFSPLPVPDNIGDWPLELALRPSQIQASAADTALMVPAAAQLSTRYKELQLPIVIMAGDHDKIARFEKQSAKLHSMLPASELMTVEGAGHMVHYAAPERLQAAIDRAASLALGSAVSHGAGEDLVPETEASAF